MPSDHNMPFSKRFGHHEAAPDIMIREDAPDDMRYAVVSIAEDDLNLKPSVLRNIICRVLRVAPEQGNWSEYPNIWSEVQELINNCKWYKVYDISEAIYRCLADSPRFDAHEYERLLNECFVDMGIGWQMSDGLIQARGDDVFEMTVRPAVADITSSPLAVASSEITEALRDLSRRPNPDLSGAVQHSVSALEAASRYTVGDAKSTLGDIVKKNPDLFPSPLGTAVEKLWGYSSEIARHGREGRQLEREEVELLVGVAAVLASYLARKLD